MWVVLWMTATTIIQAINWIKGEFVWSVVFKGVRSRSKETHFSLSYPKGDLGTETLIRNWVLPRSSRKVQIYLWLGETLLHWEKIRMPKTILSKDWTLCITYFTLQLNIPLNPHLLWFLALCVRCVHYIGTLSETNSEYCLSVAQ